MTKTAVGWGFLALIALAGPAAAETPAQLEANKTLVIRFIHEVFDAQDVSKAKDFLASGNGYIQHNPSVPSGLAGFESTFGKLFTKPKSPADIKLSKFEQVVAEGDLVQVMMRAPRPDPKNPGKTYDSYWFDLFRVKNGKIVEHWDSALLTSPGMAPDF